MMACPQLVATAPFMACSMSPEKSPFPCGWPGSELEGYRQPPRESAVSWFPYETLPPLPGGLFRGDFQWLASQPLRSNLADHQIESRRDYLDEMALAAPVKLSVLRTAAGQLGLSIPQPRSWRLAQPDAQRIWYSPRSGSGCIPTALPSASSRLRRTIVHSAEALNAETLVRRA